MKKIPTLFERQYENHKVSGITDKLTDEPLCKIKRTDFGFEWPLKGGESND